MAANHFTAIGIVTSYHARLSKLNEKAGQQMAEYVAAHGTEDGPALIAYANALVTKYGEGSAELACQMYDAMAEASKASVPAAEPAAMAEYGEVARMVNATKRQNPANLPNGVRRLVKRAGADTTLHNAIRDGAEWAWVPHGDTCPFCMMLASNGWQKASAKLLKGGHASHIHANCDCEFAVRFDSNTGVAGYDQEKYLRQYRAAGSDVNAMRRIDYAARKDAINAQKRAAYAARKALTSDENGGILDIVEQVVGAKKDSKISLLSAVSGTNPNYAVGTPYAVNCQRCVQAYELRRRGYDVIAKPKPKARNTVDWGSECFIQPGENAYKAYHMRQTEHAVKQAIESAPNGARFSVYVQWSRKYGSGAHVFIAEKLGGTVHYFDPQTGNMDASDYFSRGSKGLFGYFRLDDKKLTTEETVISATVEVKKP